MARALAPFLVTPAKAAVQGSRWSLAALDSRFRGNDEYCALTASLSHCEILKEKGQVLTQQDILVEQDLAVGDPPIAPDAPQQVLALADQDVGLGLDPVAVDQEAASDGDLDGLHRRGIDLDQLDVGEE